MATPSGDSNEVRYDILIEARAAIASLREFLKLSQDNTEKVMVFSRTVLEQSKAMGVSWKELLGVYKQLNAELSKQHKATVFGNTGGKDLFADSEKYLESLDQAGRATQNVTQATEQMGETGARASGKFAAGLHLVRIALGALEAMLIFNIVQAIQNAFGTAIKNAQELEASMYRLHNAERILSGEGIDVSTKGLEEGIKRIKALLPIFSKEDIAGLVGQVAITTKSLGLTEKQIVDLSKSIAILNVNSAEEESLQQTAQKVMSSLLTSNAKGVANLGLKLGDAAIQAKAMEMGLLDAGEAASDLTEHEKGIVKVQLAIETAGDSVAGLNEYLGTNTAKIAENKAAWNDMLTTVGQILLPFIPAVTKMVQNLVDGFNTIKVAITVVMTALDTYLVLFRLVVSGNIKSLGDLKKAFNEVSTAAKQMFANLFFPEGLPTNAPEWVKKLIGGNIKPAPETPTTGSPDFGDDATANENRVKAVQEAEDKIQDIMREAADKKADIERDYGRKLEDIARDYSNKLVDIARETAQKEEDALRKYNEKVDDINRDANEKIAEANQDARRKEIDREAEFQNKLRELRDRLIFDLEDALRERDARQVLRLLRQYALDKKNLEERHKLERQDAKKDLANKLADIERERQLKLEAAKREYDQKLQEIAIGEQRALQEARIWQARQLADARLWHQRQLAEQREYLQRKLRDLAESIAQEYQLTSAGAAAIYSLLSSYAGMSGSLGTDMLSGFGGTSGGGGSTLPSSFGLQTPGIGSGLYNPYDIRNRFAEGGTLIATRPTTALFGENGPERVDITPLDKPGNNVGRFFGDKSSAMGGGSVKIALELSPDLEARVIDSTLDAFSVTLERVEREK